MNELHITVKELFPTVVAVEIWGHVLSNHKVLFLYGQYGSLLLTLIRLLLRTIV